MADVVTEACDAARPRSVAMNVDTGEKTWLTPRYILSPLGRFDLDPCCPEGGMPWRTADRMVTKAEDGLRQDWEGLRVWLNPPYGREAEPFFRKMVSRSRGGGGPCLCENGHEALAGLHLPERILGAVPASARALLQAGRDSGRDRHGTVGAHIVQRGGRGCPCARRGSAQTGRAVRLHRDPPPVSAPQF